MLMNPRINTSARVWYRQQVREHMPLHGKVGRIVAASRGPGPRNHMIDIDGTRYSVPCGNLRKE